jgi:transaldolase / glucose-6-phosphate isomerase
MNVLVLGGRVIDIELARELIRAFLNASFTGERRHLRRLARMTALESRLRALQIFGQSVSRDYHTPKLDHERRAAPPGLQKSVE